MLLLPFQDMVPLLGQAPGSAVTGPQMPPFKPLISHWNYFFLETFKRPL